MYTNPSAEITRPLEFVTLSQYFITHWLPKITPTGLKILLRLRSLSYHNPATGTMRGDIEIDQPVLAQQCGISRRTLQKAFTDDLVLGTYVQRVFQIQRDGRGRIIWEHYLYVVSMDDILTPGDKVKLLAFDKTNPPKPEEDPPKPEQDSPKRQNDAPEIQEGSPMRQTVADARQNDAPYNRDPITLIISGEGSSDSSASLFSDQDIQSAEETPWKGEYRALSKARKAALYQRAGLLAGLPEKDVAGRTAAAKALFEKEWQS